MVRFWGVVFFFGDDAGGVWITGGLLENGLLVRELEVDDDAKETYRKYQRLLSTQPETQFNYLQSQGLF